MVIERSLNNKKQRKDTPSMQVFVVGVNTPESVFLDKSLFKNKTLVKLEIEEASLPKALSSNHLSSCKLVILGSGIHNQIQLCQLIQGNIRNLPIGIFCNQRNESSFKKKLTITPSISKHIQLINISKSPESMAAMLENSIKKYLRWHQHQRSIIDIQKQIAKISYDSTDDQAYIDNLLDNIPIGVARLSDEMKTLSINRYGKNILANRIFNTNTFYFLNFPAEIQSVVKQILSDSINKKIKHTDKVLSFSINSTQKHFLISTIPVIRDSGKNNLLVILQDISAYANAQNKIYQVQRDFDQLTNTIDDVFWIASNNLSTFDYISPAFRHVWGRDERYFIRHPSRFLATIEPEDLIHVKKFMAMAKKPLPNTTEGLEFRIRRPDGTLRWLDVKLSTIQDAPNENIKLAGIARDITYRKQMELELKQLSTYDSLTGLLNRQSFSDVLKKELYNQRHKDCILALAYIDLDEFKKINDSLGHDVGDKLLIAFSERLQALLRRSDIIARLGGDEFVVILKVQSTNELIDIANKILNQSALSFKLESFQVTITLSIGITIATDNCSCSDMIQKADTAMYRAKQQGRNNFKFFHQEMNKIALKRLVIEESLQEQVKSDKITIFYQPKVCTVSGKLMGAEALMRFEHPNLASTSVEEIAKFAEETGLIIPIGELVFKSVCRQAGQWKKLGLIKENVTIAINLSSKQLNQYNLIDTVKQCMHKYQVTPSMFKLELTESAIMNGRSNEIECLHKLMKLGFTLSVDDFGTGYSSFSRLKTLPANELKIDKSFITEITTSPQDLAICEGIVKMAHALGHTVVAEGVENQQQLERLKSCACDQIQGHLISQPIDAEAMTSMLECAQ